MTTTNGTYQFCDSDSSFSIILDCAGQNCSAVLAYTNLTCTNTDSGPWHCSNGVVCASATGFSSQFSIVQDNETILQTQAVSVNGTSFGFQQGGTGNVTLANGTTSLLPPASTGAAPASSSSSSKSGATSSRHFYSLTLLLTMLILGPLVAQAQANSGKALGQAVDGIFEGLIHLFEVGGITQSKIAADFQAVAVKMCSATISLGVGAVVKAADVFGQCEEAVLAKEMSVVGSSLGLGLRTYIGLGGILTTALTAADGAAVLSLDAGLLPEVFLANSAFCALLTTVLAEVALGPSVEQLCSTLENALQAHQTASPTSLGSAPSSAAASATTTVAGSFPTASGIDVFYSTVTGSLLPIPSISPSSTAASCMLCELNFSFSSWKTTTMFCFNQSYVSTKAILSYFCTSTVAGDPVFSQLCASACRNPCDQYETEAWLAQLGSFAAGPYPDDYQCRQYCGEVGPAGNQSCLGPNGLAGTKCVGLCPGSDNCLNSDCYAMAPSATPVA